MDAKKQTAMMKLADLLKQHKVVMKKCPEIIEIIEELYVDIEKQQMGDAYYDGKNNGMDICNPLSRAKGISFEQYYNETYNK